MFVPLHDDNPLKSIRFQYVTVGLIIINVLVYLLEAIAAATRRAIASFAVVPRELLPASLLDPLISAELVSGDTIRCRSS